MPTDLLMGAIWSGVNLLLVRGAWTFSRDLFPHDAVLVRILHTVFVCWAGIVGLGTLLGLLGLLNGPCFLAGGASLALLLSFPRSRSSLVRLCSGGSFTPPGLRDAGRGDDASLSEPGPQGEFWWAVFWSAVLAFWCGRILLEGLLEFPGDWDSLMYHIPITDHFLQTGTLFSRDCAVWYNPSNNELFGVWMVAPFTGDFLIASSNLPAGILFVLATIEVGRQLGLREHLCHLTALAGLANFAVLRQLLDAGNDIPVASFALAALCYGLRYVRFGHLPDLLFGSLGLGLGAGIKYFALGPAAVVGVALVLAALVLGQRRSAARLVLVGLLGTLLGGGAWYLRNAILTGYPLYPMGMSAGTDPMQDIYPEPWRSSLLGTARPEVLLLLEKALWKYAGPCHYLAFLLLPASVLGLVVTGLVEYHRGRRIEGTYRLVACFVLLGAGLSLGVTPFSAETVPGSLNMLRGGYSPIRFGLCFYSLALLALALFLQTCSQLLGVCFTWAAGDWFRVSRNSSMLRRTRGLLAAALIHLPQLAFAGAVAQQTWTVFQRHTPGLPADLWTGSLVGLNLLLVGWGIRRVWPIQPGLRLGVTLLLGVGCCLAVGWSADTLGQRWHAGFVAYYDRLMNTSTFGVLEKLDPATTRICTLTYRYYPFLGAARQFRAQQPKRVPDLLSLLQYLHDHDATLIAVLNIDSFQNGPYRDRLPLIRRNPRLFPPVHADQTFSVFRVDRAALEEALESARQEG